jgi:hypothetical protein
MECTTMKRSRTLKVPAIIKSIFDFVIPGLHEYTPSLKTQQTLVPGGIPGGGKSGTPVRPHQDRQLQRGGQRVILIWDHLPVHCSRLMKEFLRELHAASRGRFALQAILILVTSYEFQVAFSARSGLRGNNLY